MEKNRMEIVGMERNSEWRKSYAKFLCRRLKIQ